MHKIRFMGSDISGCTFSLLDVERQPLLSVYPIMPAPPVLFILRFSKRFRRIVSLRFRFNRRIASKIMSHLPTFGIHIDFSPRLTWTRNIFASHDLEVCSNVPTFYWCRLLTYPRRLSWLANKKVEWSQSDQKLPQTVFHRLNLWFFRIFLSRNRFRYFSWFINV